MKTTFPINPDYGLAELSRRDQQLTAGALTPESSLDGLLLNAMDKAVLKFAEIMSDHSTLKVARDGVVSETMKYSFTEKMKAAEFVRDWIGRRRKLATSEENLSEAPNIDQLRAAIREETLRTLERERVLKAPQRRVGRPSKADLAEREAQAKLEKEALERHEAFEEKDNPELADDSELQRAFRTTT